MVMTTKHHEGFCHFDTKLTNYCAPKQAAGRDLVAEYVEAAQAEGLRVGFYYSLMDWHHPDGARCKTDEAARRRFVDYIHGQVRELLHELRQDRRAVVRRNWPLDADGWESEKMNRMVFATAAGHYRQQPHRASRRLRHARAAIQAAGGGLGSLHDHER